MNLKNICLSSAAALLFLPTVLTAQGTRKNVDVFTPLPPGQVKLNGGFDKDISLCNEVWQKETLPYEKLVQFFRTGRPQFALGEMWGKAVRSGSLLYRYNNDRELKEILRRTMDDFLTTARSNGLYSCLPPELQPDRNNTGDMWERAYTLRGLSQYYISVDADPRVMEAMKTEAQGIIDQVGPAPKVDINTMGWSRNKIESSSLLEPFMTIYSLTGEKRFLDFAEYIIRSGGCHGSDLFQEALDNVYPRAMGNIYPKAYEMLDVFEGLAEYYRATGEEKWLKCLTNMFHNIWNREITIIGNAGADQPYFPHWRGEAWSDTRFEQTNPKQTRMMETCIGVTWMKYCAQILRLTGDPLAMDAIERYIYNGLTGAMKHTGDGFSYCNLLNGSKTTNEGWGWKFDGLPVTCCNLHGPIGMAYIPLVAAMQAKDGPVINLYNDASITASSASGSKVDLEISGGFPWSGDVAVAVKPAKKEKFTLRLRIPIWSEDTKVTVNGSPVQAVKAGEYLCIKRAWKDGDTVKLSFDMTGRLHDAPHGSNPAGDAFQAITYGPIVLSRDENTDPAYMAPVHVKAKDGVVALEKVSPLLPTTRLQFRVPVEGPEGSILMCDYASVNNWNGTHICTWLPTSE